jgi:exonuclease VII small subunit
MNDDSPESAMERLEEFGRKIFRVAKDDLKKAEEAVEKVVDDAIGPPPAKGPALAEDED